MSSHWVGSCGVANRLWCNCLRLQHTFGYTWCVKPVCIALCVCCSSSVFPHCLKHVATIGEALLYSMVMFDNSFRNHLSPLAVRCWHSCKYYCLLTYATGWGSVHAWGLLPELVGVNMLKHGPPLEFHHRSNSRGKNTLSFTLHPAPFVCKQR